MVSSSVLQSTQPDVCEMCESISSLLFSDPQHLSHTHTPLPWWKIYLDKLWFRVLGIKKKPNGSPLMVSSSVLKSTQPDVCELCESMSLLQFSCP